MPPIKKAVKYFSLIFFASFCSLQTSAQSSRKIDSLYKVYLSAKDTSRLIAFTNFNRQLIIRGFYDSSAVLTERMIKEAEALSASKNPAFAKRAKRSLITLHNDRGVMEFSRGGYKEALNYYSYALKNNADADSASHALAYAKIAAVYDRLSNYSMAIEYNYRALKLHEKSGDKKGLAGVYNNIGNVQSSLGNLQEALKYYKLSFAMKKELGDKRALGSSYINLGVTYGDLGNQEESMRNFQEGKKLLEETGAKSHLALAINNIGSIYHKQGKYNEAAKYYKEAYDLSEEIGDREGICRGLRNTSAVQLLQNDLAGVEQKLLLALKFAQENDLVEDIHHTHETLSDYYHKKGNAAKELHHYKLFIALRDSINSVSNNKKLMQTQMQHEYEKKEQLAKLEQARKDAINEAEKKRGKIILYSVTFSLILVILLVVVALRSLVLNRKKNAIITQQKEYALKQRDLPEVKQKEILDSIRYAKRIQQSLLPSDNFIDKKLKGLKKPEN